MSFIPLILLITILLIVIGWAIKTYMNERFLSSDPMLKKLQHDIGLVPGAEAINSVAMYTGKKSYTINKEKMYLCLKYKDGKYYDPRMLYYVVLHELAHVINGDIGHTESFYREFDKLKKSAEFGGERGNGIWVPLTGVNGEILEENGKELVDRQGNPILVKIFDSSYKIDSNYCMYVPEGSE